MRRVASQRAVVGGPFSIIHIVFLGVSARRFRPSQSARFQTLNAMIAMQMRAVARLKVVVGSLCTPTRTICLGVSTKRLSRNARFQRISAKIASGMSQAANLRVAVGSQ